MRCEEDSETNGCPCFFRLYGGEEREKKRWEYYAGVPSLSAFLNPPTLRPSPPSVSLSHRPPPALYQTAALAVFLSFFAAERTLTESDSGSDTAIYLITLVVFFSRGHVTPVPILY